MEPAVCGGSGGSYLIGEPKGTSSDQHASTQVPLGGKKWEPTSGLYRLPRLHNISRQDFTSTKRLFELSLDKVKRKLGSIINRTWVMCSMKLRKEGASF